jgi:hypothetical protein
MRFDHVGSISVFPLFITFAHLLFHGVMVLFCRPGVVSYLDRGCFCGFGLFTLLYHCRFWWRVTRPTMKQRLWRFPFLTLTWAGPFWACVSEYKLHAVLSI